jgi:hypothetical protein
MFSHQSDILEGLVLVEALIAPTAELERPPAHEKPTPRPQPDAALVVPGCQELHELRQEALGSAKKTGSKIRPAPVRAPDALTNNGKNHAINPGAAQALARDHTGLQVRVLPPGAK